MLESEENCQGGPPLEDNALLQKFRGWRNELDSLRGGVQPPMRTPGRLSSQSPEREGGLFSD